MKFSKLRIVGFKSFVEPMEFVIGNGLTGVVGPNGCGKSNLVEALRWVMGENSYKNMRASGMDDVIFSGSSKRPARNSAEVTLFLENSDRTAPAAFNDADALEVSRRIERESGSNYKINAKDVRARDVQLLFADASTGARSPALVRQGQIGELIDAKPTSRRQILEEAAGISGLHSRRHEAEIRLRGAEQNLDRLEDVLVQLDSQLDSLKRQSRQATRYKNLSSEIRSAEAGILYIRWTEAKDALETAQDQFSKAQATVSEAAARQTETSRLQAIAAHKLPDLREKVAKKGALLQRLIIARNELDAEERRVKERLQELERQLAQLTEDIRREQSMVSENDDALESLLEERSELEAENEGVDERSQAARDKVDEAQAFVRELENELADLTASEARALAERQQLERAVAENIRLLERLTAEVDQSKRALQMLVDQLANQEDLDEKRTALELAEQVLLEAEAAVEEAEAVTQEARISEQDARGPLNDAQKCLQGLETESRTLEQVLKVFSDQDHEPVVEQLQVASGYEMALGVALGDDLDASLDQAAAVKWAATLDSAEDPGLPDGAVPMIDLVQAPEALHRRLKQIGVVAPSQGARLQESLVPGQRLVTRDGDLWRWDGFVVAANAPTAAAQRLAQKNRLAEIEVELDEARRLVADKITALEEAGAGVRSAVEHEQLARGKVRDGQRKALAAREAIASAESTFSQLVAKKEAAEENAGRLVEELEHARERKLESEAELERAPQASMLGAQITSLKERLGSARNKLTETQAISEGFAREQQIRVKRLQAIAREYDGWKTRAANAKQQVVILNERRENAEEERVTLLETPEEIELKRRSLFSEISNSEAEKKEHDDQLAVAERDLLEVDRNAKTAIEAMTSAREEKVRAEERLEAAKDRKSDLEQRIQEDLEVTIAALPEIAGLKSGAPLPNPDALERKLERLKAERERLGGVNLRADDELREIDEQKTNLVSERDDLIEAIRRLRTGISKINREARERLLTSFDVVNGHFQRLFTHLFGGGTAELKLVDAEDPLEAGLEIIARPPGKKPQTMTLLSGGEQALTAISLIFAVFLTNPAPICVLDEVDAPLDDANVERYCDLLDEMVASTETRFMVVTHNPITMARMSRLFGVTMAERGVSQLVSVDLETAERFRETA